jgi:hypothetical protein
MVPILGKGGRNCDDKHVSGFDLGRGTQQSALDDALYEAISPHTAFLIEKNLAIYNTTDVKVD